MEIDIRDKENITHDDILRLNFIKSSSAYFFRKHFQEGLRSRLMQVLNPAEVALETTGIMNEGIKWFPPAQPLYMLRLFKNRFESFSDVEQEIQNFKIIQKYLPKNHYADSQEMIVSYFISGGYEILLCGLQEYVEGQIFDPWREDAQDRLTAYYSERPSAKQSVSAFVESVNASALSFVHHIKLMIQQAGYVPDLAGSGNIRITEDGCMKLVDINNISRICFDHRIRLDDKGYPVCDKSIEALSKIEAYFSGRRPNRRESIYQLFLTRERMLSVREFEKTFHEHTSASGNYPRIGADRDNRV
jgi:hypothetical protein